MHYKLFVSAIRAYNINFGKSLGFLFPDEYSAARIHDNSLHCSARLFASRESAVEHTWKKCGSILEIGVASGNHAISLISATSATSYLGIDINFGQLTVNSKQSMKDLSANCHIELRSEDSRNVLRQLQAEARTFDNIYIDANHWHAFVSDELSLCASLVSDGGRIVLNDYLDWFTGSMEPCGVKRAVNEFLALNQDWCVDYYVINDSDISLTKRNLP